MMAAALDTVNRYLGAHNRHDLVAALDCLAEDIHYHKVGEWEKHCKEEVYSIEEWDAAIQSNFEVYDIQEDPGEVRCKLIEHNQWLRNIGIEQALYSSMLFKISGESILEIVLEYSAQAQKNIRLILDQILAWAGKERSIFLDQLIFNNAFIYSRENAAFWGVLLKDWRESCDIPVLFDLKPSLWDPVIRGLLALAIGYPTEEKITKVSRQYHENSNWRLTGYSMNNKIVGLAGFELTSPGKAVVRHIAVSPPMRKRGIGRTLLNKTSIALSLAKLSVETDRSCLEFYKKSGFSLKDLSEQNPGSARYRCEIDY
ncbi:MAG: GNAT family N-acetyltransferase [Omnitrophica WOR_2 bacterium]